MHPIAIRPRTAILLLLWVGMACGLPTTSTSVQTEIPPPIESSATSPPAATIPPATATALPPTETALPTTAPTDTSPTATPTQEPIPEAVIELAGAELPPGFSIVQFATLYRPTALAFDPNTDSVRLYAASADGSIHVLADNNGDGRADNNIIFAEGFSWPLGITIQPGSGDVYVSSNTLISVLRDFDGDFVADEVSPFVENLPVGRHQNDNLKFGPDELLYIGIGSTCDACYEEDPRSATIMRFDVTTGIGEVFATGMRNPYDLAFHPETGDLFATDNGRDDLGDDLPHEELNHIVEGGDYGFPDCWSDLQGPGCAGTIEAVALFRAHSSANSIDFYTGDRFPAEYHQRAFVLLFGSWLVDGIPTGIIQVDLTRDGDRYTAETDWFARFPDGINPLGLISGPDGALYVGDYINDAIYRISYGFP